MKKQEKKKKKKLTDIDFSHQAGNKVGSDSGATRKCRYLDSHSSNRLSFIGYLDRRPSVQFFNQARASFKKVFERFYVIQ